MTPIPVRVVGTAVRRLVRDCAAEGTTNGDGGTGLLPSGGSLRECPDVAVSRKPAGSVSADPGIMLMP